MRSNSQNRQSSRQAGTAPVGTLIGADLAHDTDYSSSVEVGVSDQKDTMGSAPEKAMIGAVVTDCLKLNVREAPGADAKVLTVIPALSELMVDLEASTEAFYKVCTAAGIYGFCMKKFIALQK